MISFSSDENFTTTKSPCEKPEWKGDGMCDDINNVESCGWDGGDCCGDNVVTTYCTACECLDPAFGTTTEKTSEAPSTCEKPDWKGDNYCDDENNVESCDWDGGDCCGDNVVSTYCSACECLDPNYATTTTTTTTTSESSFFPLFCIIISIVHFQQLLLLQPQHAGRIIGKEIPIVMI